MASKSVGQIAGTVIGAAVGFFMPGAYVALGASIGGMIGGMIDPPKGPTVVGPRLDDLSFQTSTLGAPLGRAYGTVPVLGNVVWLEGDRYREVITSEEQGGKGGSTATTETAHYYATFAVSLLRVTDATKTVALRRLWIGSNLVYDAGSDDINSIIASNTESLLFDFYSGSDDQQPNTRWQADKGVNAVSGFPGRCYIVIYDLDLEPYSRSLAMAQVKAEITTGTPTAASVVLADVIPRSDGGIFYNIGSVIFTNSSVKTCTLSHHTWNGDWNTVRADQVAEIGVDLSQTLSDNACDPWSDAAFASKLALIVHQSDIDCAPWVRWRTGNSSTRFVVFNPDGTELVNTGEVAQSVLPYAPYAVVADSGSYFLVKNGEKIYVVTGDSVVASSASTTLAWACGLSENHLFGVYFTSSTAPTCTVYKYDRTTLALVATYTQNCNGRYTRIQVISDDLFYTMSPTDGKIWAWSSGVASDTGLTFGAWPAGGTELDYFHVVSETMALALRDSGGATPIRQLHAAYLKYNAATASLRDIVTSECSLCDIGSSEIDLDELVDSTVRGDRIASVASVRSSLEMLQAAYPFDVAPSGYKLRFVSRGGASLATIPETDLGAVAGGDAFPVLMPSSREMDTQIPYKVSVRYLDPAREYDIGEQYASRPDAASVSERTVELSLVLTGDEAAQAADVLNQKDWVERTSYGPFSLPPTWRNLEPPDVVTVEHRGQSHSVRLTRAETLPDGRIICSAVPSSAQSYTSTALAQNPLTVGQSVLALKGSTSGYLLDIPRIRSEQDVPGMVFGLLGKSTGWPGGVLLRSDDSGNTWPACGATNTRVNVFQSSGLLAAHHSYSMDCGAVLTVTPVTPGATIASLSETQLYAHGNLAAYGADGRWEIVAFKTVTDNSGTYTLKNFLRGLYGTEWHSGTHVAGDFLVMLDVANVGFFGLPVNAIGSPRLYRAVTQGAATDSAADVSDTYDAVNLKPLAPVDLKGHRDPSTLDWSILFSRRSRSPVEVFSGFEVPLGESSAAYSCDVFDGAGFSTVMRTISSSTEEIPYTRAQQETDFATVQEWLYLDIYQVSSVVGRGFPLRAAINRYADVDPYAADVFLFMMMEDVGLTDAMGSAVSLSGNVTRSSNNPAIGDYCAYFDGTGDYISVTCGADFDLGLADFTLEGYAHIGTYTTARAIASKYTSWTANVDFSIEVLATTGKLRFIAGDAAAINISSDAAVPTSAMFHWAVCRASGVTRLFVGGDLQAATHTGTVNIPNEKTTMRLGASSEATPSDYLLGYQDALRFTKAARYTASFTPPTVMPTP